MATSTNRNATDGSRPEQVAVGRAHQQRDGDREQRPAPTRGCAPWRRRRAQRSRPASQRRSATSAMPSSATQIGTCGACGSCAARMQRAEPPELRRRQRRRRARRPCARQRGSLMAGRGARAPPSICAAMLAPHAGREAQRREPQREGPRGALAGQHPGAEARRRAFGGRAWRAARRQVEHDLAAAAARRRTPWSTSRRRARRSSTRRAASGSPRW